LAQLLWPWMPFPRAKAESPREHGEEGGDEGVMGPQGLVAVVQAAITPDGVLPSDRLWMQVSEAITATLTDPMSSPVRINERMAREFVLLCRAAHVALRDVDRACADECRSVERDLDRTCALLKDMSAMQLVQRDLQDDEEDDVAPRSDADDPSDRDEDHHTGDLDVDEWDGDWEAPRAGSKRARARRNARGITVGAAIGSSSAGAGSSSSSAAAAAAGGGTKMSQDECVRAIKARTGGSMAPGDIVGAMTKRGRRATSTAEALPDETVFPLLKFVVANIRNPYPDSTAKAALVRESGLNATRVKNWLTNLRKRHLTPLLKHGKHPTSQFELDLLLIAGAAGVQIGAWPCGFLEDDDD
jgi:Homeobox KN domain